jgi:hypothetical protein
LSDRIIGQKERDIQIIDSTYYGFLNFQKNNFLENDNDVEGLNDKFQIKLAYQATNPTNLRNEYEDKLVVNSLSASENRLNEYFNADALRFVSNLSELYNKAYIGEDGSKYFGADIYKFFNEDLRLSDLDSTQENKIVIFTDGYMFVSGKQGEDIPLVDILPSNKFAQKNIEVLLVEITPKEDKEGEFNRLEQGWNNWFKNMGIKSQLVKKNKLGTTIDKLHTFLGFPVNYSNSENNAPVENNDLQMKATATVEKEILKETPKTEDIPQPITKEIPKNPALQQKKQNPIAVKESKVLPFESQRKAKNIIPKTKKKVHKNEMDGPKWVEDKAK